MPIERMGGTSAAQEFAEKMSEWSFRGRNLAEESGFFLEPERKADPSLRSG
jgi:hypothetical protein